jgi:hypothetical protein
MKLVDVISWSFIKIFMKCHAIFHEIPWIVIKFPEHLMDIWRIFFFHENSIHEISFLKNHDIFMKCHEKFHRFMEYFSPDMFCMKCLMARTWIWGPTPRPWGARISVVGAGLEPWWRPESGAPWRHFVLSQSRWRRLCNTCWTLQERQRNRRNPHTDLPPFLTRQSHETGLHCCVWQQSSISAFFLVCLSFMDTKNVTWDSGLFHSACWYTQCTALEWPADNAEITSYFWHSAV